MRLTHAVSQYRIIVAKLSYHIERLDVFGVVIRDTLKAGDLPDRSNGCAAYLPGSFSNGIRHREYLVTLVIQHQMIIAEMRARHMPVKVLGFEIQGERVREKQH